MAAAAPRCAARGVAAEPVADPADGPPGRQLRHERGQLAGWQRLGPGPAGQGEQDLVAVLAADQAPARREDLHRAAGPVPHPADGERARTGARGPHADAGVVRRDQGREPLGPALVSRLGPGRVRLARIGPGYFRDAIRAELGQHLPG